MKFGFHYDVESLEFCRLWWGRFLWQHSEYSFGTSAREMEGCTLSIALTQGSFITA